MPNDKLRNLGSIYTPVEFARLLVNWGIRSKSDKVLDLGIGEGVFTFLALERLRELGAPQTVACRQLYGSEIHAPTFETFTQLAEERDVNFPYVMQGDFLAQDFPIVETALGNPSYVRRSAIVDFDTLTEESDITSDEIPVSRLSELYIYFLLRAVSQLKVGGRLAVITADTWLNVRYGEAFKQALVDNFTIESLISFDRAVFPDIQVKPVLLFATKVKDTSSRRKVWFIRAQNGLSPNILLPLVERQRSTLPDVSVKKIEAGHLETSDTWAKHFKSSDLIAEISSHSLMTELQDQFETHIGVQTLANDFFVLFSEQISSLQIEGKFLTPFIHSSQYYKAPVIEKNTITTHHLFWCSETKPELDGTQALRYIEDGEKKEVPVRGKGYSVTGYQNKDNELLGSPLAGGNILNTLS